MRKPRAIKKKYDKKLSSQEFTYLSIIAVLYLLFVWTYAKTINYPGWGYVKLIVIFEVALCAYYRKLVLQQIREAVDVLDKVLTTGFLAVSGFIILTFACGILLIPVNFYNLHYANSNPVLPVNCRITGITDAGRTHAIYYDFDGHKNSIHVNFNSSPTLHSLRDKMDYGNYTLLIYARKGLMDTYVYSSFNLTRK